MPVADQAPVLIGAVIALVTDSHKHCGAHMRIADYAFLLALFAQSPDGDARHFPTHYQVWVVLSHSIIICISICQNYVIRQSQSYFCFPSPKLYGIKFFIFMHILITINDWNTNKVATVMASLCLLVPLKISWHSGFVEIEHKFVTGLAVRRD